MPRERERERREIEEEGDGEREKKEGERKRLGLDRVNVKGCFSLCVLLSKYKRPFLPREKLPMFIIHLHILCVCVCVCALYNFYLYLSHKEMAIADYMIGASALDKIMETYSSPLTME